MNSLIKHSRKIIIAFLMFVFVLTANFGLINSTISFVNAAEVFGFKGFNNEVDVSIANESFSLKDSNEDEYPYTPKNWTFNASKSADYVKHGLVNLDSTQYKNNYENYELGEKENPGLIGASSDKYALMINSRKYASSCGYVSDPFTLNKGGIYHVSVNVYTDNVDGSASLYLFNGDSVFAKITNINAKGEWSEKAYHFLIQTKDYENLDLTLGLWQGSKDVKAQSMVMFDEVSAGQISQATLNSLIKNTGLDGKTNVNYENIAYVNLDGENSLNSENLEINASNVTIVSEESNNISNTDYSKYFFNTATGNSVEIENVQDNYIAFETNEYELLSNKVYKFSVLAKTENLVTGNAFFRAKEVADNGKSSSDISIKTTKNVLNDNYTEYSIIIVSDPLKTRTIKLQFGLGTTSASAKGKVSFKGIEVSSVPYSEFSSADSSKSATIDFSADYDLSEIDNLVPNFAFYKAEAQIAGDNKVAIANASDWTINKSGENNVQLAGVFNVADYDILDKSELNNIVNPGFITSINDETNNVLMLHNQMSDYLTAKSASVSLSAETIYNVSVWVNTQVATGTASISVSDKNDSSLTYGEISDINTMGQWAEYTLSIKTGYDDLDVNLNLNLGTLTDKAKGYVFFDNCFINTAEQEDFDGAENKIDLSNPLDYSSNNKPQYFTGKSTAEGSSTVSGLLNIEDLSSVLMKAEQDEAKAGFVGENSNVLAIHSTNVDDYYTLTSKLNYTLNSGSYYKLSVDVYTAYLQTDAEEGLAGASIKLSNLENGEFVGIVSKLNEETNSKWTTYTFYINPDSTTTSELVLGLGSESTPAHGTALFANINFEQIEDKDTYVSLTENVNDQTKVLGKVITDEDSTSETSADSDINWQLLIYTLTAVAVIVAVLGVAFKKLFKPNKKRVKKTVVDYDRSSSMSRQKYRKLAYLKRDKDIRKLEKELNLLNAEKQDKEQKYKQLLSKVREVKLANRDGKLKSELASLNKDLTKASHNVAKIGVQVNKINNEIALMKTEGYLQGLERRLMKQDELAKAKGLSIEAMIMSELEDVTIENDNSVDNAISKAEQILESKKEIEENSEIEERPEVIEATEDKVEDETKGSENFAPESETEKVEQQVEEVEKTVENNENAENLAGDNENSNNE